MISSPHTKAADGVGLTIVAPAFNEAGGLDAFVRRVLAVLDEIDCSAEVVLVDDGSQDSTWAVIEREAQRDARVRGVRLSRNFGHQIALSAGMTFATGDTVVTLDADLQHPPEMIPTLLDTARLGYDVVYAVRSPADGERFAKRMTARVFYWLLTKTTSLDLPEGAADFRLMSRRVVDVLLSMPERHRFLRGMTRWAGFSQTFVLYERARRPHGDSKYGLAKMSALAWDAIASFSVAPLRFGALIGMVATGIGWTYLGYVVCAHFLTSTTVPGWTSVTAAILALGGLQLVFLSVIAQYVGRTYEESKRRPLFVVADTTQSRENGSALAALMLEAARVP